MDGRPATGPTPVPPDLALHISSLLEGLVRAGPALRAADPSGQLWASCHLFRVQAWRFGVGAPNARLLRARQERCLGELAEQAGDLSAAILHYRAALASYARVGVKRRLTRLTPHVAPAATAPEAPPVETGAGDAPNTSASSMRVLQNASGDAEPAAILAPRLAEFSEKEHECPLRALVTGFSHAPSLAGKVRMRKASLRG